MKKGYYILLIALVFLCSCTEIETDTRDESSVADETSTDSYAESIESIAPYSEEKSWDDEIELPAFPSEEESLEESSFEESSEEVSEEAKPNEIITVGENIYTNITDENALKLLLQIEETAAGYKNASFVYRDTVTGYYFYRHRENVYPTVSVIKAFYCQYLMESGVDLEQKIQLTKVDRDSTSKKLREQDIGTWFTVTELMSYAIRYSDNMAYRLLYNTFGRNGFNEYTSSLGIDDIRLQSLEYTNMSVDSGAVYLERIYRYALETGEFFLIDLMKDLKVSDFTY